MPIRAVKLIRRPQAAAVWEKEKLGDPAHLSVDPPLPEEAMGDRKLPMNGNTGKPLKLVYNAEMRELLCCEKTYNSVCCIKYDATRSYIWLLDGAIEMKCAQLNASPARICSLAIPPHLQSRFVSRSQRRQSGQVRVRTRLLLSAPGQHHQVLL